MSYEINVFLNSVSDEIIDKWEEKLNGFGYKCEIHPEFSFAGLNSMFFDLYDILTLHIINVQVRFA